MDIYKKIEEKEKPKEKKIYKGGEKLVFEFAEFCNSKKINIKLHLRKYDTSNKGTISDDKFMNAIIELKTSFTENDIKDLINYCKPKDGFDYKYNFNEKIILKGDLITMNIKFNKIKGIITNIGRKPILIFGNSEGDSSMANFVVSNNEYKSLAFMVLNDDLERERGNLVEAEKMKDLCHKNNWVPISMKNDWKTIYGENVTKNNISY